MALILDSRPTLSQALQASRLIRDLDRYYPDVTDWYVNRVVPGIYTGTDKIIIARDGTTPVGIALGKADTEEVKLRCIRVAPDHQNTGLGIRLIDRMLDLLEHDRPLVTVSEELIHDYSRAFVRRYGFELSDVSKGLYRPRKLEYIFN